MDAIRKIEDSEKFDAELWAELYTLRAAVKGPEGYTSWQDAAVDERMKRHAAERTLASKEAELAEAGLKYVSLFGELQGAMEEIERLKADGRAVRRMLGEQWCANQMIPFPYTDDGEFSDGSVHPCIDFMNDQAADIRKKMQTRLLSAIPAKTRKKSLTTTPQPTE